MSLVGLLDVVAGDPALRGALEAADRGHRVARPHGPGRAAAVPRGGARRAHRPPGARRHRDRPGGRGPRRRARQRASTRDRVALYPGWETLPHERLSPRADTVGRRIAVLRRLAHPSADDPATGPVDVVVAPVRSLLQPQVRGLGDLEPVALVQGQDADPDVVVRRLVDLAYARVELVEKRGEFAVRGGILDVFPPTEEHPVRVEFWGDTVEEVRWFAVADQRSLAGDGPAHGLWAPPCRELLLTDDVRARARALTTTHPELADICDRIADGTPVEGMEALAPVLVDDLVLLVDELPARTTVARLRPRADPHPCARPRPHQPGVPRGVLGDRGRRGRGAGRPRRCGLPHARRRPRPRPRPRAAVVERHPVHHRRRARGRHRRARGPAGPGLPRRDRAGARGRPGLARAGLGGRAHHRGPRPGAARRRGARRRRRARPARGGPHRPAAPGRRRGDDRLPRHRLRVGPAQDRRAHRDRPHRHARPGRQGHEHADALAPPQRRRPAAAQARRPGRARPARRRPLRRDGPAHRRGRHPRVPHPRVRPEQARPAGRPAVRPHRPARAGHPLRRRRGALAGPPRRRRLGQAQGPRQEGGQGDRGRPHPALQRADGRARARLRPRHALAARARGRLPVRRDARPAVGDRRGQGRHGEALADGPGHRRRRRLRQDRDRGPRGLQGGAGRQAGRGAGADHAARAAAPRHLPRPLRAVPGDRALDQPLQLRQGAEGGPGRAHRRHRRRRHRHAPAAVQGHPLQGPRPGHRRRGAALRRRAQGAPQAAAHRRGRADHVGDPDPAHARDEPHRHPRDVDDPHPAGGAAPGADLRRALRREADRGRHPARAAARGPGLLPAQPGRVDRPRWPRGSASSCPRRASRPATGR